MSNPTYSFKKAQMRKHETLRCPYCGDSFYVKDMVADHIVPRSGGGANRVANFIMCCKKCNSYKSSLPLENFWEKAELRCEKSFESYNYWYKVKENLRNLVME